MQFRTTLFSLFALLVVPFSLAQEDDESRLRQAKAKASATPLPVVIELLDDVRDLNGSLLDTDDLEVKTAFGSAKMPLSEVLGIRLPREADDTTTVVLHNGDMITGKVDIQNLLVQTSWGKSEVNGNNLASIFFDEGLRWTQLKLLAGDRWTLAKDEEDAPAATRQASAADAQKKEPRSGNGSSVLVRQQ